jgi:hypothetical protein
VTGVFVHILQIIVNWPGKETVMARMVKGAKRYVLLRGRDENGDDIVIAIFSKKELDAALEEGRICEEDHVVKVEVLGGLDLKKLSKPKRG